MEQSPKKQMPRSCPHCGSHPSSAMKVYYGAYAVVCGLCKARGPIDATEQHAIRAWNERVS